MDLDYLRLGKELLSLLTILTPFSVLPVYVTLTAGMNEEERERSLRKTLLTVLVTLLFFQWTGLFLFKIMGVALPSFQIAGGLIIASVAWSMLHASPSRTQTTPPEDQEALAREDFSIVPLAIPMLSGPGAITTVILLSQQRPTAPGTFLLSGLIIVSVALLYPAFRLAQPLFNKLGVSGTRVVTRVMGMVLLAIAVEFVVQGMVRALSVLR